MNDTASRTVTAYLNVIEENPVLSQEEQGQLFEQIAQEPPDSSTRTQAINKLIAANLGLVFYVARRYPVSVLPYEDLLGWGCLGLAKAADRARPNAALFSNYALPYIRGSIQEGIRSNRLIQLTSYQTGKYIEARSLLDNEESQTEPLPDSVLRWKDFHQDAISLDMETDEMRSLNERIADPNSIHPGHAVSNASEKDLLLKVVDELPDREAHLITRHFGLDGQDPVSIAEAGQDLGISKQRVHIIYQHALQLVKQKYLEAQLSIA